MNKSKIRRITGLVEMMFDAPILIEESDIKYIRDVFHEEILSGIPSRMSANLLDLFYDIERISSLGSDSRFTDNYKTSFFLKLNDILLDTYRFDCLMWGVEPEV